MDYTSIIFNLYSKPVETNTLKTETGFSEDGKPIDYKWWDDRARNPKPLTPEEEKVIYSCGGLTYLRICGQERGFDTAKLRTVSEKHYIDCPDNCICGRHDTE